MNKNFYALIKKEFMLVSSPLPPDELERIQELEGLFLLDTPAEERFDRITRLALSLFEVPIALITLVDEERVWIKSSQGLAVTQVPREISFCTYAILGPEPLVVPDASKDERFMENPFVKGEPHILFYAGCPLKGPKGHRIGTLCLIDLRTREFKEKDFQNLRDLAAIAEIELGVVKINQTHRKLIQERDQLRSQALVDSLTRLWNRGAVLEILEMERSRARRKGLSVGVIMADLDHFKKINDLYGHPVGDTVLLETAHRIRTSLRSTDAAGRYGGEEFMVILPEVDLALASQIAERIRTSLAMDPYVTTSGHLSVTLSLGVGVIPHDRETRLDSVIAQVDKALYQAKADGRNRMCACQIE
jgi:diguanylate cyclase (GGDEF)-like protein